MAEQKTDKERLSGMDRSRAMLIAKIVAIAMILVFFITYAEAGAYAKAGGSNAIVGGALLVANTGSLIIGVVDIILFFLIWRGRFSFDDDIGAEQPAQESLYDNSASMPPANDNYSPQANTQPFVCVVCGHSIKQIGAVLSHTTSFTDIRSGITYCSVLAGGKICGCEKPTAPKPKPVAVKPKQDSRWGGKQAGKSGDDDSGFEIMGGLN